MSGSVCQLMCEKEEMKPKRRQTSEARGWTKIRKRLTGIFEIESKKVDRAPKLRIYRDYAIPVLSQSSYLFAVLVPSLAAIL